MGLSTAISSDFLIERQSSDSDKEAIKILMEEKQRADASCTTLNIESSLTDTSAIITDFYPMVFRLRRSVKRRVLKPGFFKLYPRASCAPACPALFDCANFIEVASSTTTITNLGVETTYSTVISSCMASGTCQPTACWDLTVLS